MMPFQIYKPGQLGLASARKSEHDSDSADCESDQNITPDQIIARGNNIHRQSQ